MLNAVTTRKGMHGDVPVKDVLITKAYEVKSK